MSQPIVYVDTSEVQPGRLEELKVAMTDFGAVRAGERAAAARLQRVLQ